jgi:hypothetical protein
MDITTLSKNDLKKALPTIKRKIEWQPTPVTRLTDEQKLAQLEQLRSMIGNKQSTNQPDPTQAPGG